MKVTYEWESLFGRVVLVVEPRRSLTPENWRRLAGHVEDLDEMVRLLTDAAEPF